MARKSKQHYIDRYNADHYIHPRVRLPKGIDYKGRSISGYLQRLVSLDTGSGYPWIAERTGARCSCCYTKFDYDLYYSPVTWNYCPACGAYMVQSKDRETVKE